ncbi:hypothetical protein BC941DRAFT_366144 [Chlamydoabsidia padenii]|nr:hypothetical protein BC941DRAFT_366144 [Chlamydoabsidia padenii]
MTTNNNQPHTFKSQFSTKKALRLVLDEPVLYVEDKPAMVRGEVIVHFSYDTTIQGPIELSFEAIQTFYPWAEIMVNRAIGGPIESKLQVIELSLLPPNTQGIMPAGTHRFPFEFPIPPTLPPTIKITNRLAIYYRLTATLRKAHEGTSLADWARRSVTKKKLTDVSHLRLVRAIEATPPRPMTPPPSSPTETSFPSGTDNNRVVIPYQQDLWALYNNRLSLDEQHDQLVHSMGGRTTDNYSRPLDEMDKERGVRFKLSVDRTAVALGTSVGLEVVLQPTRVRTKIRSIYLCLEERRSYKMNIPGRHSSLSDSPAETRRHTETNKMKLKWAYAYPIPPGEGVVGSTDNKKNITLLGHQYSHDIRECFILRELDQPFYERQQQPQQPQQQDGSQDKRYAATSILSAIKPSLATTGSEKKSSSSSPNAGLLDLKLLDHAIELGEYFEGRFVLPVPPCHGMLHPSMDHDSIKIQHWLRMVVILEQEGGNKFEISLQSPAHILDCRLVADDERQTILPPPPSYQLGDDDRSIPSSVFWEQRQPITTLAQWGTCRRPCPCQINQYKTKKAATQINRGGGNNNNNNNHNGLDTRGHQQQQERPVVAGLQPEWGPPPLYTE